MSKSYEESYEESRNLYERNLEVLLYDTLQKFLEIEIVIFDPEIPNYRLRAGLRAIAESGS